MKERKKKRESTEGRLTWREEKSDRGVPLSKAVKDRSSQGHMRGPQAGTLTCILSSASYNTYNHRGKGHAPKTVWSREEERECVGRGVRESIQLTMSSFHFCAGP